MEKFDIEKYKYYYLLAFVALTFVFFVWHAFSYITTNTDLNSIETQEIQTDADIDDNYNEENADTDADSDDDDDTSDEDEDSDNSDDDDEEEDEEVEEYINSMSDTNEYIRSTKSRRVGQY